ncbi:MAG: hypothetical protein H7Y15_09780 [Pseudonocardia sp.]|nr:hypothetical protein [Pseudonocardia sp.]
MDVTQQTLLAENGRRVVVATTEAGSPSEAAMVLLAHRTADSASHPPSPAPGRLFRRD